MCDGSWYFVVTAAEVATIVPFKTTSIYCRGRGAEISSAYYTATQLGDV